MLLTDSYWSTIFSVSTTSSRVERSYAFILLAQYS